MTAPEIARRLTPAQIRALRDVPNSDRWDWSALLDAEEQVGAEFTQAPGPTLTPLGREVLAELDKEAGK